MFKFIKEGKFCLAVTRDRGCETVKILNVNKKDQTADVTIIYPPSDFIYKVQGQQLFENETPARIYQDERERTYNVNEEKYLIHNEQCISVIIKDTTRKSVLKVVTEAHEIIEVRKKQLFEYQAQAIKQLQINEGV